MVVPNSADGYTLIGRETPEVTTCTPGRETPEVTACTPLSTTACNSEDGYVGDSGYDYDYQEPYFEPASKEEELIVQLSTKLAVTDIPREDLESVN